MSKTILVIEDEVSIRKVIKAFLEDAGYTVFEAGDGQEGLEKFRQQSPDLILLDLMLPKMNGFSVCEVIRKESRVPIIMLTALDSEADQMKGFDALADDYITKPFSMPLVVRHIEAVTLTTREFEILRFLLENQDKVITRENIMDSIWGYEYLGDEKIVNTHIKNIRRKLGVDYIETIRGAGYKIEKEN